MSLIKYNGRGYTFSIQSVYGLLEWNDTSLTNKSKTKLLPKQHKNSKLLVQFTDKDFKDNRYVHGSDNAYYYNFYHWQYVDIFIYTNVGLFDIPPPGYINAAHLNGTKILGTLMAPVNQHQYINQFNYLFREKNGIYPCADKMVKIMDYYGFDGWFVNIEEMLPENITWVNVQGFMKYLVQKSKAVNEHAEIHWYDSNYIFGTQSYENELNKKNVCMLQDKGIISTGFFINYAWSDRGLKTSVETANKVNRPNNDIYAGLFLESLQYPEDVVQRIKVAIGRGLSVGIWGLDYLRKISNTKEQLQSNSNELWSYIGTIIENKYIIDTLPFNTYFSNGQGSALFKQGKKISNYPWGCMSQQDIPLIKNEKYVNGSFRCQITNELSYEGGTCIKYTKINSSGTTSLFHLFDTDIQLNEYIILKIIIHNENNIKFDVLFNGDHKLKYSSKTKLCDEWTEIIYKFNDTCTVENIYLRLDGGSMFDSFYLGCVSINENVDAMEQVSNLVIKDVEWQIDNYSKISANMTLEWEDDKAKYYDIYIKRPDYGYYFWFARAYNNSYRVENIYIKGDVLWENNDIYFCVYPTDYTGNTISESPKIKFDWNPDNSYLGMIQREKN